MVQRKTLVQADARIYGAAARQDLASLLSGQGAPLSAAEQSQLSEYAVPMVAAWQFFNPLRPRKQMRSIYEMEDRRKVQGRVPRKHMMTHTSMCVPHQKYVLYVS